MRQWFGLKSEASTEDVLKQFGALLLKQSRSFAPLGWGGVGVATALPARGPKPAEGALARMATVFASLAILAGEQVGPVVCLVDQLDKVHDSPRWLVVATQLLAASVLVTLPMLIIFFFGQRYFIEGIATTGIKG